ncbi:lysophospholipid acyltransferase family protein [Chitinophagaceae bacterium LB-8]|uniref:Lysophospholipid acyltransferase family protein n=1 Tax=Paraflavisolibacter caeni TaxID=2982496 RepID=A0A9X2XZC7_9BACT|nr:lysophospholipid acyltransferase family protein [Paraflavisolibacter caeni]MCU7551701.1 lysophospholipid acyltransferase family protein [Paraflavisolibacter caeni]
MYYIVFGPLYLLSLLPIRVLYVFSDFAYLIIYHILGYRKKIVLQNLSIAFPEKSEKEKLRIAKQFYRNFTDNFIETIKFLSAGDRYFKKHFNCNPEIFDTLYAQGKKCHVLLAHNFNWELGNLAITSLTPYQMLTVYMPIQNRIFDRLFKYMRTRTGVKLLSAHNMRNDMIPYRNQQYLIALVADQNPGNLRFAWWFNFFNRPAPFVKGPEKGARSNNSAVVFCYFTKPKRGYYEAHFTLATTDPASLPELELTKRYVTYLEKVISDRPDMWLWSHRRWKHEWKPEYGKVIDRE